MPKHRKTQKKRAAKAPAMTIPELRSSMEYIVSYSQSLASKGSKSVKDAAKDFAAEWKKVFGKTLPTKTAEQYVKHMMSMRSPRSKKGTRKMRGGAYDDSIGAPLGYQLGPGADLPYGKFEQYVSKGFWNPEPAILADCGKQTGVLPYPETGSNKMNGGGLLDGASNALAAIGFRPFVAQNPPTPQQDLQTAWKGQALGPGPNSYQQAWTSHMSKPAMPPIQGIATYERNLNQVGPV